MPKITYTATHAGQTFTRTTDSRTYTHCVVARPSYEMDLRVAANTRWDETEASNYRFYRAQIEAGVGNRYSAGSHLFHALSQNDFDRAVALIGDATSEAEFVATREAARVAAVEAKKAAGRHDTFLCLGWNGRHGLAITAATKARNGGWYEDVTILEAIRRA